MDNITNDIPKYRKKSSASPPAKAKHKHVYEPCLLEHPLDWWNKPHERKRYVPHLEFRSYCPVCGKVGDRDRDRWRTTVKKRNDSGKSYIEVVPPRKPNANLILVLGRCRSLRLRIRL